MSNSHSLPELPRPEAWSPPSPLPVSFNTERLTLRFWDHADAPGLFEVVNRGRESFLPWLPWVRKDHFRVEETTFYIERCIRTRRDEPGRDYAMAIIERASGRVIGGTGLHRIHAGAHEAEIGYFVRADSRGQGYCTEATRALLTWALTPPSGGGWGFRRVHIRCAAKNVASAAVPRKLGLRHEGTLVKDRWVDGQGWDDTLIFGVLAEEWRG